MRKFLGIVCLILGLTLLISSIVNIIQPLKNDGVTAYADEEELYDYQRTVYIPNDTFSFVVLSPYPIVYSDMNGGTFILWCVGDVFYLGVTRYEANLPNTAELLGSFTLSEYFETTHQITGPWIGDTGLMSNDIFITSTFSLFDSDLGDCVRFVPNGYTLDIIINIERLNRCYTLTAEGSSYDIYFSDDLYVPYFEFLLQTIDTTTLFQQGYNEGYDYGREIGFTQGKDYGYGLGYQNGIDENFNGDMFGTTIVPSINSLMNIELMPNVSFSTIFSIVFGLILIGLCIKIFLGG